MATVREFFEELPTRIDASRTAGMNTSYVFDVTDVGAWTVRVTDGAVSVTEGAEEADCTISANEETLTRIVNGEQNATTAFMTGRLKVRGDMGQAMKLQQLF